MTGPVIASTVVRTSTLHWWAVAAAAVALIAPLPDDWRFTVQVAALVFGVVALCLVRGPAARSIAALVVIVVGAVICLQVAAQVAALLLERSFSGDAVVVG